MQHAQTIVAPALDSAANHNRDGKSQIRLKKLGGWESEALARSTAELSALLGVSANTARDWRRVHRIPRIWWRAVRALVLGDLGAISEAWRGWRIQADHLTAPDGGAFVFTPGEICGMRFKPPPPQNEQLIEHLQAEIRMLEAQIREMEEFNPEHPLQADWIERRFDPAPDPEPDIEDRLAQAEAEVERLEHAERVRASQPRPNYRYMWGHR